MIVEISISSETKYWLDRFRESIFGYDYIIMELLDYRLRYLELAKRKSKNAEPIPRINPQKELNEFIEVEK